VRLTPAVSADTVYSLVGAELEEPAIAGLAGTVMSSMPASTDSVTYFPALLAWANSDHVPNDLVARDEAFLRAT
jgi:hypothetical protein